MCIFNIFLSAQPFHSVLQRFSSHINPPRCMQAHKTRHFFCVFFVLCKQTKHHSNLFIHTNKHTQHFRSHLVPTLVTLSPFLLCPLSFFSLSLLVFRFPYLSVVFHSALFTSSSLFTFPPPPPIPRAPPS